MGSIPGLCSTIGLLGKIVYGTITLALLLVQSNGRVTHETSLHTPMAQNPMPGDELALGLLQNTRNMFN